MQGQHQSMENDLMAFTHGEPPRYLSSLQHWNRKGIYPTSLFYHLCNTFILFICRIQFL